VKKPKPITAKELGVILHKEFERDAWGTIDPDYLKNPPKANEAEPDDMGGLYEVLERAAKKINKRLGVA
jgi:hypothetical protein